jgi:hypothetical protein
LELLENAGNNSEPFTNLEGSEMDLCLIEDNTLASYLQVEGQYNSYDESSRPTTYNMAHFENNVESNMLKSPRI